MITIFTTCRPFRAEHVVHQRNSIKSWREAIPDVDIMLLGDADGTETAAREMGVRHYGGFETRFDKPYVADLWRVAREHAQYATQLYVNADIILLSDFWPAAQVVMKRFVDFLVIGRRTDIDVYGPLVSEQWEAKLRDHISKTGRLYSNLGTDFFLFRGDFYRDTIPSKMVIACTLWDNWLIWRALNAGVPVVTATEAVTTVHQPHPQDQQGWDPAARHYNFQSVPQPWGQFTRGNQDATWLLREDLSLEER